MFAMLTHNKKHLLAWKESSLIHSVGFQNNEDFFVSAPPRV